MPADRRVAPRFAARTLDVFAIEVPGDRAWRLAGGELCKDASHNGRLRLDDLTIATKRGAIFGAPRHRTVAICLAATRLALPHPPFNASMCLEGKVLEEEGIHRALQADMQLAHLAVGAGVDHDAN